jgi:hypothetical protein
MKNPDDLEIVLVFMMVALIVLWAVFVIEMACVHS